MSTTTKPRKLTTMEKRAQAMCADFARYGSANFTVEHKRSSMYGLNPSLEYWGVKVAHASGCGYCKLSTVLAEALRFLGRTDEENMAIWRTAGAGVSSVQKALKGCGWILTGTGSSNTSDSYSLVREAKADGSGDRVSMREALEAAEAFLSGPLADRLTGDEMASTGADDVLAKVRAALGVEA